MPGKEKDSDSSSSATQNESKPYFPAVHRSAVRSEPGIPTVSMMYRFSILVRRRPQILANPVGQKIGLSQ
jgi:hypothetical protein